MSNVGQKEILTQKHVVRFFQDELGYEWNPGRLPPSLTLEKLR